MTRFVANARMYSVAPEAEAAWRALLLHIAEDAGEALEYMSYPAPQPLEVLWARDDLGAVQMCGYPIARRLADVIPLAAPIPLAEWAGGRPLYRSDLIVRVDSPYRSLADTFGGRLGWTVEHSHSGFNALRHHLLQYRSAVRPVLYREVIGPLITAGRVLDSVRKGAIDVGPLDAYWHALIEKYRPELTADIRVLESTELAPIPAFVSARTMPCDVARRLRDALSHAATRDWFPRLGAALLIQGFAPVEIEDFAAMLAWDADANAAGYPVPA